MNALAKRVTSKEKPETTQPQTKVFELKKSEDTTEESSASKFSKGFKKALGRKGY